MDALTLRLNSKALKSENTISGDRAKIFHCQAIFHHVLPFSKQSTNDFKIDLFMGEIFSQCGERWDHVQNSYFKLFHCLSALHCKSIKLSQKNRELVFLDFSALMEQGKGFPHFFCRLALHDSFNIYIRNGRLDHIASKTIQIINKEILSVNSICKFST